MSHFTVLVVVDGEVTRETAEDVVGPLLKPYDENGEWFAEGSKWDWWEVGGRWTGSLAGSDVAKVSEIRKDFVPFAIVTPDGKWYDSGSMGWFGVKREDTMDKDTWNDQVRRIFSAHQDKMAVLVDCHV